MSDNISKTGDFELGPDEDNWEMDFDEDAEDIGLVTESAWEGDRTGQVSNIGRSGQNIGYLPSLQEEQEKREEAWEGAEDNGTVKGIYVECEGWNLEYIPFVQKANEEQDKIENTAGDEEDSVNHDEDVMIVHDDIHSLVEYFPYTGRMRYWSNETHQYVDFFSQTVVDNVKKSGALGPNNPKYALDLLSSSDGEHIRQENDEIEQDSGAEDIAKKP